MQRRIGRNDAREALQDALRRRGGSPIGTPLQEIYSRRYDTPTLTRAATFWGAEMQVVLPELVSCEIHEHGLIEPTLSALLVELVSPDAVVYDVGAHLGYHSSLAAALGARVHAFEPSRKTLPILRRNAPDGVTVAPIGLWDEEAPLELKDFGGMHSAVNTFLSAKDETLSAPEDIYPVDVTTLDRYVGETKEVPHLIKIDAEGAELQVLRGAAGTIRAAHPFISIEVGDTIEERTSRSALEFAIELDYVPYDLTENGLRPHTLRDVYPYGNLLLTPRGTRPPTLPALGRGPR